MGKTPEVRRVFVGKATRYVCHGQVGLRTSGIAHFQLESSVIRRLRGRSEIIEEEDDMYWPDDTFSKAGDAWSAPLRNHLSLPFGAPRV